VYYVEQNPNYIAVADNVFDRFASGTVQAVTSPITLAECLIGPIRAGLTQARQNFADLIIAGANVTFWRLDAPTADRAAELRVQYNLSLTDAFQVAAAMEAGCDALLTNDQGLKRVQSIPILVLDDLEL
jgi:predicted nucleic acid-binding protein